MGEIWSLKDPTILLLKKRRGPRGPYKKHRRKYKLTQENKPKFELLF